MSKVPEPPGERYRGERLNLPGKLPPWSRSILVLGRNTGALAGLLHKRLPADVAAVEADSRHAEVLAQVIDHVLPATCTRAPAPFPGGHFDLAILQDARPWDGEESKLLAWLLPLLSKPFGSLYVLEENADVSQVLAAAQQMGWAHYNSWSQEGLTLRRIIWPDYSPLELAQQLARANRHAWAYSELANVPDSYLAQDEVALGVNLLQLSYLAPVYRSTPGPFTAEDVSRTQLHFYEVIARDPLCEDAYLCFDDVTKDTKASFLARRALRSMLQATGQPLAWEPRPFPNAPSRTPASDFAWPDAPPRVLFIIHPRPHFGLDVLFDGLCEVLGDEQICAWPWKPSLHGNAPEGLTQYPCTFARRGQPRTHEEVLTALENGEFDLLLFGDCELEMPVKDSKQLLDAAARRGIPVALIDQLDECMDIRPRLNARLHFDAFALYFKRELPLFDDFGPECHALPFAYAKSRVLPHPGPRDIPLFWAGHRKSGLRRLFLEHLERRFGLDLEGAYTQAEYAARLARSQATLSLYGMGYDTVRFWEAPAHGSMLLSERMPLHLPHPFQDGVNAVFFDELADLEAKVEWVLENPDAVAAIAAAGERHYLSHHTSEARARQMLSVLHAHSRGVPNGHP